MIQAWAGRRQEWRSCWNLFGQLDPSYPPSLVEVLAQRAESEEQAALDNVADSNNNNNLSVGEEDGEYEHNDEDEVLKEIDLEDLFSDDEEDE